MYARARARARARYIKSIMSICNHQILWLKTYICKNGELARFFDEKMLLLPLFDRESGGESHFFTDIFLQIPPPKEIFYFYFGIISPFFKIFLRRERFKRGKFVSILQIWGCRKPRQRA